jgi:hypothetical protein
MLACVVGIPVVALSGASWSEMVKKLQDFRWPAVLGMASASSPAPLEAVPGPIPLSVAGPPSPGGPGPVLPPAAELPAQDSSAGVVPAGYQAAEATPQNVGAAGPIDSAALAADPFHAIQDRLRRLGATYYLLESWGNRDQVYRFYCKMAVGGSADYTRCYEATHADPLEAMRQVLRQVEAQTDGSTGSATER